MVYSGMGRILLTCRKTTNMTLDEVLLGMTLLGHVNLIGGWTLLDRE